MFLGSFRITPRLLNYTAVRGFKVFTPALFKIGDTIPTGLKGIYESSPGNDVDIGKEVTNGKFIIVGVPAAFSPACSSAHVPGFINLLDDFKAKGISQVLITCVNDPFVTKAWASQLNCPPDLRILADTQGEFAKAAGKLFDSKKIFGNERSSRYALIVKDGKVLNQFLEPDKIGLKFSTAETVLSAL
ncbi:thioredoxin peroxidase AHP1 Ecym_2055 [Eremothecium cymbalariae DBVPG|uniref:Thioredoxin domain-containing protein n=1 Tax=Eremothecium cymbalariae (strain CBS 270.75 / DBVPG 7215 / KCTC 17166 / NRRL Y-17582) TaxID=931890 RepID=G8JP12_ERECY|nr:Hypothetical protein Ecym_2055 [Eremothecium cymbalariae DBVPG\